MWKLQKFSLTLISQKFRESNGFTYIKKLLNSWFDEIFCEREFPVFPHFVKVTNLLRSWFHEIVFSEREFPVCVENRKILSHWKKFREINSLVTSLVNSLLSRNFCQKSLRQFLQLLYIYYIMQCTLHCTAWKNGWFTITWKIFREKNFYCK